MKLPDIWQPEFWPSKRYRILDCTWMPSHRFFLWWMFWLDFDGSVFRRSSLSCIQNSSTMPCPWQRKMAAPKGDSFYWLVDNLFDWDVQYDKKIAFSAWLLEPDVNSNNGHSNCHSHPRWRLPDRFYYLHCFSHVCCKIIASNVQQTEPNDWQAI